MIPDVLCLGALAIVVTATWTVTLRRRRTRRQACICRKCRPRLDAERLAAAVDRATRGS